MSSTHFELVNVYITKFYIEMEWKMFNFEELRANYTLLVEWPIYNFYFYGKQPVIVLLRPAIININDRVFYVKSLSEMSCNTWRPKK